MSRRWFDPFGPLDGGPVPQHVPPEPDTTERSFTRLRVRGGPHDGEQYDLPDDSASSDVELPAKTHRNRRTEKGRYRVVRPTDGTAPYLDHVVDDAAPPDHGRRPHG